MGVYIKDMEMPKNCAECRYPCKHYDCPLVEIQSPHGDLADKDKLIQEFMDSDLGHLQRDDWKEVIQIVEDAPTVIEAEESET